MTITLNPELYERFKSFNQEHVFQFFDKLNDSERTQLIADAEHLDLAAVSANYTKVLKDEQAMSQTVSQPIELSPFEAVTDSSQVDPAQRKLWFENGLRAIADSSVCAVLMAGGQGTRLGSSAPKGCYDIGLPSHKSLFELQANRISRLITLAAQHTNKDLSSTNQSINLPWFIMTSIATHKATVEYFKSKSFFGLDEKHVHFFMQHELPALSNEGKILLESPSKIALSPNGNGGIFHALETSGSLKIMRDSGIQHVHVYGVDNALVKVADPTLIGFALHNQAQCVNKVVLKRDPHEKVGVMAMKEGVPHVVEYSEIPSHLATAVNAAGQLIYSAGNIVQHYFHINFLAKVFDEPLPFHVARKAVPFVDVNGEVIKPVQPNAIKLEMFIFDIFARDPSMSCLAVQRAEEFTAVKNKEGVDSPASARADVCQLHRSWAEAAGATFSGPGDVEISPLVSYAGEGLDARCTGVRFDPPVEIA